MIKPLNVRVLSFINPLYPIHLESFELTIRSTGQEWIDCPGKEGPGRGYSKAKRPHGQTEAWSHQRYDENCQSRKDIRAPPVESMIITHESRPSPVNSTHEPDFPVA